MRLVRQPESAAVFRMAGLPTRQRTDTRAHTCPNVMETIAQWIIGALTEMTQLPVQKSWKLSSPISFLSPRCVRSTDNNIRNFISARACATHAHDVSVWAVK